MREHGRGPRGGFPLFAYSEYKHKAYTGRSKVCMNENVQDEGLKMTA